MMVVGLALLAACDPGDGRGTAGNVTGIASVGPLEGTDGPAESTTDGGGGDLTTTSGADGSSGGGENGSADGPRFDHHLVRVRAAAGTVVYSGSGLRGYGELIIVQHNDTFLSAYAHNEARLVKEGRHVDAGETIARMGNSDTTDVMLHFEIRRNGKAVDPLQYLPNR